jgi:alginate O-acetyltransferase complex protein AlgI
MAENQNYTELKEWAKHFLQVVTSDDLYYGIFLLIALLISLKAIDLVFRPFRKKNVISSVFLKGVIQAFLIITIGMKIITLSPALSGFTSQILMSSSLIVVVLGFVMFRADTVGAGFAILGRMFSFSGAGMAGKMAAEAILTPDRVTGLALGCLFSLPVVPALEKKLRVPGREALREAGADLLALAGLAVCLLAMAGGGFSPFIYQQF